jgi:hypothetical protein
MLLTTEEESMDNVVWICGEAGAPKGARLERPSVPIEEEYDKMTRRNGFK